MRWERVSLVVCSENCCARVLVAVRRSMAVRMSHAKPPVVAARGLLQVLGNVGCEVFYLLRAHHHLVVAVDDVVHRQRACLVQIYVGGMRSVNRVRIP